jgi:hypothetical protein
VHTICAHQPAATHQLLLWGEQHLQAHDHTGSQYFSTTPARPCCTSAVISTGVPYLFIKLHHLDSSCSRSNQYQQHCVSGLLFQQAGVLSTQPGTQPTQHLHSLLLTWVVCQGLSLLTGHLPAAAHQSVRCRHARSPASHRLCSNQVETQFKSQFTLVSLLCCINPGVEAMIAAPHIITSPAPRSLTCTPGPQ